MNIVTVMKQVGMLSIIMLIGFVVVKAGYVEAKVKDAISKLIVKLILPCLIISSISEKDLESQLLGELFTVAVMTLFCIAVLFVMGILTAKIMKIPDSTAPVHKLLASMGNVVFIGYPIITAIYGETGFFFAIIYWLINDLFLWTVGVMMLSKEEGKEKKNIMKKLINPNTISFVIAIVMFALGIKLPPVVREAVSGIGELTTCLSMIFIGMTLATVNVRNIVRKWWVLVLAPLKLVIMPAVFMFLFMLMGIKEILLGVVVLEAAMPAQTVLSIIAYDNNADYEYAAAGMFLSTVASIITLPFICYLIKLFV